MKTHRTLGYCDHYEFIINTIQKEKKLNKYENEENITRKALCQELVQPGWHDAAKWRLPNGETRECLIFHYL